MYDIINRTAPGCLLCHIAMVHQQHGQVICAFPLIDFSGIHYHCLRFKSEDMTKRCLLKCMVGQIGTTKCLLMNQKHMTFRTVFRSLRCFFKCSSVLTLHQLHPVPVYENVSALTNHLAPAAQREPIEEQDGHHCAIIHTSSSDNQ